MGFSVVTTVLAPAASYDLTDLATVKDELSIGAANNASNTWLSRAISQASQAIANDTDRVFPPEYVQDNFDIEQDAHPYQTPGGLAVLQLARWPVLGVASVTQTLSIGSIQTLTEGVDFRADLDAGQLLRLNPYTGSGSTWEARPVVVNYMAGFGSKVQETRTVPASPYQVTVTQAAAFSCDQAVARANGSALVRVSANPAVGQYSLAAGVYTFNATDTGQSLTITYGARAIPADLVEICLRLITGRFYAKGRDPSLVQRDTPGIGIERFWFGGAPGQKGAFPPEIDGALEFYRVHVVV